MKRLFGSKRRFAGMKVLKVVSIKETLKSFTSRRALAAVSTRGPASQRQTKRSIKH